MEYLVTSIPESHADLLVRPVLVSLATVQPDGQPQVTPVWADTENNHIRVNTAAGRQKWKNLVERPQVTILAVDPEDPYRWMEIRGKVTSHTEDGADSVIDQLAKKYLGVDTYPGHNPEETRVTFLIEPTRVVTGG